MKNNDMHKSFFKKALPILMVFAAMVFIGCRQSTPGNSKKNDSNAGSTPGGNTGKKQDDKKKPSPKPNGQPPLLETIDLPLSGENITVTGVKDGSIGRIRFDFRANKNSVFIPGRTVTLSPYSIGKYEVSYRDWEAVRLWAVGNGYTFANNGQKGNDSSGSDLQPVAEVSWRDCIIWCNAFTEMIGGKDEQCVYRKKDAPEIILKDAASTDCNSAVCDLTKKGFRLPTAAEWEYASRFQHKKENAVEYGTGVFFTRLDSISGASDYYEDLNEAKRLMWNYDSTDRKGLTKPVGTKAANALGLHDMSGNVWEWVFDFNGTPKSGDETNPTGPESGNNRLCMGGSAAGLAAYCVCASKTPLSPYNTNAGILNTFNKKIEPVGFRVVRTK